MGLGGVLQAEEAAEMTPTVYQILYKPQIREDVPFTSIYNEAYTSDEVEVGYQPDSDPLFQMNAFDTSKAAGFTVGEDPFGAKAALGELKVEEKPLNCDNQSYMSEQFDPTTMTYRRYCVGIDNRSVAYDTSVNAYADESVDKQKAPDEQYANQNYFIKAMLSEDKFDGNFDPEDAEMMGNLVLSGEVVSFLESIAGSDPYLRPLIDQVLSTGDVSQLFLGFRSEGISKLKELRRRR